MMPPKILYVNYTLFFKKIKSMRHFTHYFILLFILSFLSNSTFAQEESESGHEIEESRHTIFLGFGWAHIPKGGHVDDTEANGFLVPTLGLCFSPLINRT